MSLLKFLLFHLLQSHLPVITTGQLNGLIIIIKYSLGLRVYYTIDVMGSFGLDILGIRYFLRYILRVKLKLFTLFMVHYLTVHYGEGIPRILGSIS